ncbi:hypothetical protein PPERSA_11769 [Pseudocohnilembus persalinus]|uniref:Uncharacterized protein n=1 Tax=Pseudocohnilembus persalinus TaxID=266149 RepID=A0A0V0QGR9_PSEPJ|nr:hypothetical protein PPERSA_11769 [Pseudocohnilembus persalinus]|eukprot:KRX01322.1 hypothetical protein PPERSA_11769 [Pseudocohnilembus persalinus]
MDQKILQQTQTPQKNKKNQINYNNQSSFQLLENINQEQSIQNHKKQCSPQSQRLQTLIYNQQNERNSFTLLSQYNQQVQKKQLEAISQKIRSISYNPSPVKNNNYNNNSLEQNQNIIDGIKKINYQNSNQKLLEPIHIQIHKQYQQIKNQSPIQSPKQIKNNQNNLVKLGKQKNSQFLPTAVDFKQQQQAQIQQINKDYQKFKESQQNFQKTGLYSPKQKGENKQNSKVLIIKKNLNADNLEPIVKKYHNINEIEKKNQTRQFKTADQSPDMIGFQTKNLEQNQKLNSNENITNNNYIQKKKFIQRINFLKSLDNNKLQEQLEILQKQLSRHKKQSLQQNEYINGNENEQYNLENHFYKIKNKVKAPFNKKSKIKSQDEKKIDNYAQQLKTLKNFISYDPKKALQCDLQTQKNQQDDTLLQIQQLSTQNELGQLSGEVTDGQNSSLQKSLQNENKQQKGSTNKGNLQTNQKISFQKNSNYKKDIQYIKLEGIQLKDQKIQNNTSEENKLQQDSNENSQNQQKEILDTSMCFDDQNIAYQQLKQENQKMNKSKINAIKIQQGQKFKEIIEENKILENQKHSKNKSDKQKQEKQQKFEIKENLDNQNGNLQENQTSSNYSNSQNQENFYKYLGDEYDENQKLNQIYENNQQIIYNLNEQNSISQLQNDKIQQKLQPNNQQQFSTPKNSPNVLSFFIGDIQKDTENILQQQQNQQKNLKKNFASQQKKQTTPNKQI